MDFMALTEIDWIREAIGAVAIVCGMIGKWKLGSHVKNGWTWAFLAGFCWFLFSLRIESPTGLINNAIYILLSVRGYRLWEKYQVMGAASD